MANDTYHHGDLKNALLEAARQQLEAAGASSLNLRALARELGITHPAVYRHFKDKDSLLEAVAQLGFEELADALHANETRSNNLGECLHASTETYLGFALNNPELVRVMFALIPAERREQNVPLYTASKRAYAALLDMVANVEGDPYVNSAVIWATLHGLTMLTLEQQVPKLVDKTTRAEVIGKAVAVLQKGLS